MVKVLVGVPCMETVPIEFVGSLMALEWDNKEHMMMANSLVYDARNQIANHAIVNGFDYLLFIDSDMVFPADGLKKLMAHDKDIVGGLYFGRRGKHEPIAYKEVTPRGWFDNPSCTPIDKFQGLQEVQGMGLGFCLIKLQDILRHIYGYIPRSTDKDREKRL